jgi:RimJ/RimL family protein N-acetyltransferase
MVEEDISGTYAMLKELAKIEKVKISSLEEFKASFSQQDLPNQFMIMERKGKVIGFCGIQIWEEGIKQGYAGLRGPIIDPLHQGRKLAQHLLKAVIPLAAAKGLQKVRAMIRSDNQKGIHLAEKYGMQPLSHRFTMRLHPLKPLLFRPLPDRYQIRPMREEEKGFGTCLASGKCGRYKT